MTGPQNYQAAELLAQKAEAHLCGGDHESAAVWASLARTHAILASAAATTLGEQEIWAWREIAGSEIAGSKLYSSCVQSTQLALLCHDLPPQAVCGVAQYSR